MRTRIGVVDRETGADALARTAGFFFFWILDFVLDIITVQFVDPSVQMDGLFILGTPGVVIIDNHLRLGKRAYYL